MRKLILTITAVLLMGGVSFAGLLGGASPVTNSSGTTSIAVVSDQSIYTASFPMDKSDVFGVWLKATSASSTPSITVELQESYRLPTTEGAADSNYVEPDGFSDIFTALADEVAHVTTLSPVPMPYGRYKITGGAGNPADTVVTIYNFTQGNN